MSQSHQNVGFIGLGNVGGKLAGNLFRQLKALTVHDISEDKVRSFVSLGATSADTPKALAKAVDIVITCLPSPEICAEVMESEAGVINGLSEGKVWLEMSTTDASEINRLAAKVEAIGAKAMDCPVSGGCHRAETGNISIFAGGDRQTFEQVLPVLSILGRNILHTGELGSASVLKVLTNYLATANLVALTEALTVVQKLGMDTNTAYEAIRISSGNSFVHETESQVILNGSRNIGFTMDLVLKDIGLFQAIAEAQDVPLELSPLLIDIFKLGIHQYGGRELSPNIIKRLEDNMGIQVSGTGFPEELVDDEPQQKGYEVEVRR